MSQKNLASVLILIATALGGPAAVDHVQSVPEPDPIEIQGPTQVMIGELVQLTYDGRDVTWIAPTDDFQIVDNGHAVVSFRAPGEYEITAGGKVGSGVGLDTHTIFVEGKLPEPTPVPDQSVVEPTPEPDQPAATLTNLVYQWCQEVDADKQVAMKVADNFITAASTTSTVDGLLRKTAELNRSIEQGELADVLVKAQRYMIKNLTGSDFVSHQCAWDEIAQGLIQWSES